MQTPGSGGLPVVGTPLPSSQRWAPMAPSRPGSLWTALPMGGSPFLGTQHPPPRPSWCADTPSLVQTESLGEGYQVTLRLLPGPQSFWRWGRGFFSPSEMGLAWLGHSQGGRQVGGRGPLRQSTQTGRKSSPGKLSCLSLLICALSISMAPSLTHLVTQGEHRPALSGGVSLWMEAVTGHTHGLP